ncbi:restriction endonuclease subunit S [Denitrificimonas caeni]|uniref:Restriction endonuclease subunit S n=1 Tax=Denitrificimonas caeni TaxID=521720 RepID=A0AAE9VMI4_9GAMM|nr:restriction endonuclease subunit S [Denitrificimonas caeni]WBE24649.1 restriction endonuclease subunit S [Denitrificimonas caeni]
MNKDEVAEMSQQYQVEAAEKLVPEGYKLTEVGVIPEDWEVVTLGTVGEIKMCKRIFKNQTKDVAEVPFYKIGTFGREPDAFISKELFDEYRSKYSYPKTGEILISAAGTIGRTVIFDGQPSYFQDSNIIWISNDEGKVLNSYLWHYYKVVKWSTSEGGIVSRLYNDNIRNNVFIAYPATTEQKEIAAALSDTEALVSELEKLIAKKQAIKTATMQQLLTGRTRLSQFAHHPDGSKKGYKQSELGEIPEDWGVEALGENCHTYSGGTPSTSNSSFYGGDIKWITSSDLNRSLIFEVRGRITELGLEKSAAKMIQPGTFLIALYGATAGVCAISKISAAINQAVLAVIPKNHSSKYLYYWFNKNKDEIIDTYTQGGQPNLSGNIIRSVKLPIPLADEQTAIATILSDMDEEIQALEHRLNKTRQIKQGMMQQLLTGKVRLV